MSRIQRVLVFQLPIMALFAWAFAAPAAALPACEDGWMLATSAPPGSTVALSPGADSEDLRVELIADGPPREVAYLTQESGEVFLAVPIHPNRSLDGGRVDLTFHGGGGSCGVAGFVIEPLQPAPGAFRSYLEGAIERARTQAEAAGLDPETIDSEALSRLDLRTLPPLAVPIALNLIHAAELERALVELDGSLAEDPAGAALLDALFAGAAEANATDEPGAEQSAAVDLGSRGLEPWRIASVDIPFPTERPKISTAAELAKVMWPAVKALNKLNGISGKVLNDASLVLTVGGLIPGPGGVIATAAATAAFVYKTSQELKAYGNPTRFTRLDVKMSTDRFSYEDSPHKLAIEKITADVASEPWNVTLKVFDTVRAGKPGGLTLNGLQKIGMKLDARSARFLAWLGLGGTASDAASNVADRPGHAVPKVLVIPAHHWRDIDMFDKNYLKVEILSAAGRPPAVIPTAYDWNEVEAANAGWSDIHVTAPRPIFGDEALDKVRIHVPTIAITAKSAAANPHRVPAHQSAELCFLVDIEKAKDKTVKATMTGPGRSSDSILAVADGEGLNCFSVEPIPNAGRYENCQAPPEEIRQSYEFAAVALASKGARRPNHPQVERPRRRGSTIHPLVRPVEQRDPEPEECEERDLVANWTWTFANGTLNCRKLPFAVTLPGFSSPVQLEELDDGTLSITGAATGDNLRVKPLGLQGDAGHEVETYRGRVSAPESLGLGGDLQADYTLYVTSSELLTGSMELKDAPYEGDVCSISWPFSMSPRN